MVVEEVAPTFDPLKVYELPLTSIFADEDWNCRGFIDPTSVLELANSIRTTELQQPVVVMLNPEVSSMPTKPFKLVAGYRRYKAHQLIKKETIKSLIKTKMTEMDARVLNLTENLQRTDLNIKQEAHAISRLRLMSQEDIAHRVNKSRGWVQTRIALLQLPDDIQDEAAAGLMTSAQIQACARLGDSDAQYDYVRRLKDAKLRGKDKKVDPEKLIKKAHEKRLRSGAEIEEIQDIVRGLFGNGITTRLLGWSAGLVTTQDAHRAIRDEASKQGKFYSMPEGLD